MQRLPDLQAHALYRAVEETGGQRCAHAALAVGQHQHEEKAYSDVMYVEPLMGPDTINTMTPQTMDAHRDHGDPAPRLEDGMADSAAQLKQLVELGIDLAAATEELEAEGIRKFAEPYQKVIATLQAKMSVCK